MLPPQLPEVACHEPSGGVTLEEETVKRARLLATHLPVAHFALAALALAGCQVSGSVAGPDTTSTGAAGIVLADATGLTTSESGTTATFGVSLAAAPRADVTIAVTSQDTSEVAVSSSLATLTFTAANWSTAQRVTLVGQDDTVVDGNIALAVTLDPSTSADAAYQALAPVSVPVTNNDNDTPGLNVTPTSLNTAEGGGAVTFTVQPTTQPAASIIVSITSGDTSEGTLSPAQLTFTAANWATAQTVTVTPVDDTDQDGTLTYSIALSLSMSTEASYAALAALSVTVANADNDTPGLAIKPLVLTTHEGGAEVTFTVRPRSVIAVGDSVSIDLTSQNTAEGTPKSFTVQPNAQPAPGTTISLSIASTDTSEGTLGTSLLTFDDGNWTVPQVVDVYPQSDGVVDGDIVYAVTLDPSASTTVGYSTLGVQSVEVTHLDVDGAITVTDITGLVPYNGTITAGAVRRYVITVTSGALYSVTLSGLSANADLMVYSDSGFMYWLGDSWNAGSADELVSVMAPGTTLYLEVDAQAAAADTNFTLNVQPYVPPTPTNLDGTLPLSGTLVHGTTRYFVTTVTPGSAYSVTATGLAGMARLRVYNDDSNFIIYSCSQTNYGAGSVRCDVTANGPLFYLTLDGVSLSADTGFTLDVQLFVPPTPTNITSGLPYSSTIASGAMQYYVVDVSAGPQTVTLTGLTDDVDLLVYTDSTFLTTECSSTHGGTSDESCTADGSSGHVYIGVDGAYVGTTANFTLGVVALPITHLTTGVLPYTDVAAPGTDNFYDLAVTAGHQYRIDLTALSANVELGVFANAPTLGAALACLSAHPGTADESCTVTANSALLSFITGNASVAASYTIDVTDLGP